MTKKNAEDFISIVKNTTYSQLKKAVQKRCPKDSSFVKECEEMLDTYVSPKNYLTWNDYVKVCLSLGCTERLRLCMKDKDLRGILATSVFRDAIAKKATARYVSKQIIESFIHTAIPELPPEIIDIFPYVHLMLPNNTVYDGQGDAVLSLIVYSGTYNSTDISEETRALGKVIFPDEEMIPAELSGSRGLQIVSFTGQGLDMFQKFIDPDARSWHEDYIKPTTEYADAHHADEQIIRIAINSLLVHLYEPELVTTDIAPVTKGVGFSSKSKAPLSPTWIGKSFRKEREESYSKVENSGRGNLRAHWRRGHWHSVCVGPKRVERRVQWFKPVYVNP